MDLLSPFGPFLRRIRRLYGLARDPPNAECKGIDGPPNAVPVITEIHILVRLFLNSAVAVLVETIRASSLVGPNHLQNIFSALTRVACIVSES